MAIGGDARSGLVVYATEDNESFSNLLAGDADDSRIISVVVGGQPGDYLAKYVVSAEMATVAVNEYVITGALALTPELGNAVTETLVLSLNCD